MPAYFFIFFMLIASAPYAQDLSEVAGYWNGSIDVYGEELNINITFSYTEGELDGTIDIPQQDSYNLPVEVTGTEGDSLIFQFETGTGPAVFHGKRAGESKSIEGNFEQVGEFFPFQIFKKRMSNGRISDLPEEEIIIPAREGQISGSLVMRSEPAPLVILLSGAGSQGRDENVAGFRLFLELSSNLYEAGYSAFRYDDRGVGQSQGYSDATLEELAEDLESIVEHFRENYQGQVENIILLGHNQGGLVASIAAQNKDVAGIVFMGTPFLRGDEMINEQILLISREREVPEDVVEMNLDFQQRVYDVARSESGWDDIEQDLYDRLEEQINELPEEQREALGDMSSFIRSQIDRQLSTAKSRWFKSLIEFEPADAIAALEIPMLALFGEKDMQVPHESSGEVAEKLADDHDVNLQSFIIPDANHLFQKADSGMPSEYGMLERMFTDGFLDILVQWLESLDDQ